MSEDFLSSAIFFEFWYYQGFWSATPTTTLLLKRLGHSVIPFLNCRLRKLCPIYILTPIENWGLKKSKKKARGISDQKSFLQN